MPEENEDRLTEQFRLISDAIASIRVDVSTMRKVMKRMEGRLERAEAIARALQDLLPSK